MSLVGFFLYGCICIAVGMFLSSITEHQFVAAILTYGVFIFMLLVPSFCTLIFGSDSWIVAVMNVIDIMSPYDMLFSGIIVVSDEVAADTVRKTLLTQVAPPGVTAHVVDVAKMIRVYNNPKYAGERVMLLFTNPTDVERLVEGGVKITSVNVGGMAFRQGKTQVNNAVSVDEKDIEAFKKLNARGIELEVRKVSTDPKLKMMDLISKIDK